LFLVDAISHLNPNNSGLRRNKIKITKLNENLNVLRSSIWKFLSFQKESLEEKRAKFANHVHTFSWKSGFSLKNYFYISIVVDFFAGKEI